MSSKTPGGPPAPPNEDVRPTPTPLLPALLPPPLALSGRGPRVDRCVLGICVTLVAATLVLIATTGDLGQFAHKEWRVGRNLALACCFLAAGHVVLRRSDRLASLARCLLAVSAATGLFTVAVMLQRTSPGLGGLDGVGGHLHIGWQRLIMGMAVLGLHGTLAVLPLWFPDGLRPARGWLVAVAAMAGVYAVYLAPIAWYGLRSRDPAWPNQDVARHLPWWEAMTEPVIWMPRLFAVAVLASLGWRMWRAGGLVRRQLAVMTVCYGVYWGVQIADKVQEFGQGGNPPHWMYLLMLGPASAALALGTVTAVVPHDLTGLDRVLRPALVALALFLGLFYCYRGLYEILSTLPGRSPVTDAALASALAVLALRPAATLLLRIVDLLFYGRRAKPYEMLHALSDGLARRMPADEVARTVCDTVVTRLGMPGAVLWAHTRHGNQELARAGVSFEPDDAGPHHVVDLSHQGDTVGRLGVLLRPGQRRLDTHDAAVLDVVGGQLAPLVQGLGLREELRASRERVVASREEERRRIRRDLHDGLGPTLAGVRLRLETAAEQVGSADERQIRDLLRDAGADTLHSITEVRRLVDGLRPPDLDEHGLPEALRRLTERAAHPGLRVEARIADMVPGLAAACEVAAYRIAAEALTNVVKHAQASTAVLSLEVDDQHLVLKVVDDGIGIAGIGIVGIGVGDGNGGRTGGVGLGSMAERAEEIGGALTTGARDDGVRGTRVHARLPRTLD
ncbi:sensor histidine kinase [Streptomyces sp. NPDC127119]|uniref:sensor histidine kinase n=1 Tax=Streptomyces sp. NPDC127119 TaxID=3345370 RepID=UPI00364237B1